ncbi:copper amine oxidase N-terminal domain-containing protein [Kyrpidia spormannii]|uniref:Copper amine oxidase domain protein n=2 Tax=Kyrpidia spormannii TaxID=2055160 RepID=A0ACA8Z8C5_9BACL|nr:copper amine oxidase N-terminal domain-containing protein [Kyrpidia spormannii]CAB3392034.1 Copper amine oxidase domain protein [Kyrpidia spormannii]CAB3392950.1 Copper amine oxidase domain protein [Kyrpidia spormannii]
MNRRIAVLGGVALVRLGLAAGGALASPGIQLVVNQRPVSPSVAPQMVDGKVVAPVRDVAEALGATVSWNDGTQTVQVDLPQTDALNRRIALLEQAVAPTTPQEAVQTWTKGVQGRNGALQYAVLSPALREQRKADFEGVGWVTGTSSSWVNEVRIGSGTQNSDGSWTFPVQFDWRTSADIGPPADWSKIPSFPVTVQEIDQHWYISDAPK